MKIRQKLLISPVLVLAFTLILGVVGASNMLSTRLSLNNLYNVHMHNVTLSNEALTEFSAAHADVYRLFNWLNNYDGKQITAATDNIEKRIEKTSMQIKQIHSTDINPETKLLLDTIASKLPDYKKNVLQAIEYAQVDPNMGLTGMQNADATFVSIEKQVRELVNLTDAQAKQQYEISNAAINHALTLFVIILFIAIVGGVAMSLLLAQRIVTPLKEAIAATHKIASGNLTATIASGDNDETGELLTALRAMQGNLREMIGNIAQAAQQLDTTANAMRKSATTIANGTGEQHEAAAQMAATIEEMSVSISVINNHASDADAAVRESSIRSEQGRAVLHRVEEAMQRIEKFVHQTAEEIRALGNESERISEIVGVIKSIADQTNLLALNAAIEAARAGELGRGFAVVADEVRSLAERTSQSTQEIANMINAIQNGVGAAVASMQSGVNLVNEGCELASGADSAVNQVAETVNHVATMIAEISAALSEQRTGSEHIANRVQHIASMAEQNTRASQTTEQSAERLGELSVAMQQSVSGFTI